MGRLMAALYDPLTWAAERAGLARWRREVLAPLRGRVLEIGPGTGANLEHYPRGIDRLVLAEPDPHMRRRLSSRVAPGLPESGSGDAHPTITAAEAGALPFRDGTFDGVVSSLVLCSVPEPDRALDQIYRVLRPGGRLAFLEHVAAEEDSRSARWQRRLEPLWKRCAGNCHLTRHTQERIAAAGFGVERVIRDELPLAPPFVRPAIRGQAVKPA